MTVKPENLVLGAAMLAGLLPGNGFAIPYQKGPWTFQVDPAAGSLSISHRQLGVVLDDIRLRIRQGGRLSAAGGWTVDDRDPNALVIASKIPAVTTWKFRVSEDRIEIQSSAADSFISGIAPAGVQRIPARVAERDRME